MAGGPECLDMRAGTKVCVRMLEFDRQWDGQSARRRTDAQFSSNTQDKQIYAHPPVTTLPRQPRSQETGWRRRGWRRDYLGEHRAVVEVVMVWSAVPSPQHHPERLTRRGRPAELFHRRQRGGRDCAPGTEPPGGWDGNGAASSGKAGLADPAVE